MQRSAAVTVALVHVHVVVVVGAALLWWVREGCGESRSAGVGGVGFSGGAVFLGGEPLSAGAIVSGW